MCGIVGQLSLNGEAVDPGLLARMRDTMVTRGPDGSGLWLSEDRSLGLAHRRLSIVDLTEAAGQPMASQDGSLQIVFNGEIYNHAEIRKELERVGGHQWQTDHSDTEVILNAYRQWGIDCLERFRGMFAIALWDVRKKELYLIRDRIGVKPLYFALNSQRLSFASEIKALLEDPRQKRAVDETAFYHYLSFLTTPAPQTLFAGIRKLSAGTWMRVRADGQVHEHRYWDVVSRAKPMTGLSEKDIAEQLLVELRTSVQLRKVSDVPVGVFLSGGIDSSTNAKLFSEGDRKGDLKTFTIGYEGKYASYQNELHYARQVSELIGSEHFEKLLKPDDLIDFLPAMVHHQDEPLADPVCVPVYYVSKLARDHGVTVCQLGEGADELFCGYPLWKTMLSVQHWNDLPVPLGAKQLGLSLLRSAGKGNAMYTEWLRRATLGQPIFWSGAEAFTETQKKTLLSPRLREKFKTYSSFEAIAPTYERFKNQFWEPSDLNWMTYADLQLRLPELLLMRVDKMTMATSLEARVPFLDHKFVELAMSIPTALKLKNGSLKSILKKAVRGVIPDTIIDRPKQGFGVPVHEWFFDRLGKRAESELMEFCDQTDFLDRRAVQELFLGQKGPKLWFLLNFALWWKHFIKSASMEAVGAL